MPDLSRRSVLGLLGLGTTLGALGAISFVGEARAARVVVIGGGIGGAETALTLRRAAPRIAVTLLERDPTGLRPGRPQPFGLPAPDFAALKAAGVHVAIDEAVGLDATGKRVLTLSGRAVAYDMAVVAPGIGFRDEAIDGYSPQTARLMPHAWTRDDGDGALERRVESLRRGGVVAIRVPDDAIRFPEGPYRRATAIAERLALTNPTAKVLILDGKADFDGRSALQARWERDLPPGMIEWLPAADGGRVHAVDGERRVLFTDRGALRADLINFIPAQRAGDFAVAAGLSDDSGWCPTRDAAGASAVLGDVAVIGDAARGPAAVKTADAAMNRARLCAATLATVL